MSVEISGALSPNTSVVRQGYLRKLKTMKKKYFVLKADTAANSARLEYYDSEKKFKTNAQPKRVISIKSCFNITRRLDTKHKHVIAFYIKEECFCVVLDGEEDLSSWLNSLLVLYHGDVGSEDLPHPRQHVWQVNIQKKGLGGAKNILGLYHLCLTDKTVSLVKIKANSVVLPTDRFLTRPIEFPLMSIRRCGDTECFFYMEIGRSAETGAGELWMHTDDANIAQSMHATILQAMCTSGKDELWPTTRNRSSSANEASKPLTALTRRQTLSGAKPGFSPSNERGSCRGGICVMLCIGPCATASATCSIERETAPAPTTPQPASVNNQTWNNTPLIHSIDTINTAVANTRRGVGDARGGEGAPAGHQRTASLPFSFAKPELAVSHERTRSLPLAGDEAKPAEAGPAKAPKGAQPWLGRRASTGCRLAKRSPGHVKNGESVRERCDSLPSRCRVVTEAASLARPFSASTGLARGLSRSPPNSDHHLNERCSSSTSVDEVDGVEWAHRTPRSIPEEEPETSTYVPMDSSLPNNTRVEKHSRTPSLAEDYLPMAPGGDAGYVPMERARDSPLSPALSSCSVTSGTPSTDMRFSEFHLDRAKCYFAPPDEEEARPVRAYSVGSRPAFRPHHAPSAAAAAADSARARAFSAGSRSRGPRPLAPPLAAPQAPPASSAKSFSAPLLAAGPNGRAAVEPLHDLMELDFSNRVVSSSPKSTRNHSSHSSSPGSRQLTLPLAAHAARPAADGYVDMSPRSSGYVEMKPADPGTGSAPLGVPRVRRASLARSPPAERPPSAPDGYVEMSYGSADGRVDRNRTASRPIMIHANNLKNKKESDSALSLGGARSPPSESRTLTPPKSSPVLSPHTPTAPHLLANGRRAARKHTARRNSKEPSTPGSQTIFPFSLNSPSSPVKPFTAEPTDKAPTAEPEHEDFDDTEDTLESPSQYMELTPSGLSTVREICEPTHTSRINFENQKSIKQMLNAAKATGKISEIQLSDYVTLKPASAMPLAGRRSAASRQNSNSSCGGGESEYTIMEPISAKGRSTHTSAPINARTRMAVRKEDAMHAKENRSNGALLSTNPTAHKSLTAEAPPKASAAPGARKPILVTISGQTPPVAANFKPAGEARGGKAGSPQPPQTGPAERRSEGAALHYAALQLDQPERSPRPTAPPCPAFTYSQIDFVKSEELSVVDKN